MKLLYPAVSILLFRNILSLLDFEGKRFDETLDKEMFVILLLWTVTILGVCINFLLTNMIIIVLISAISSFLSVIGVFVMSKTMEGSCNEILGQIFKDFSATSNFMVMFFSTFFGALLIHYLLNYGQNEVLKAWKFKSTVQKEFEFILARLEEGIITKDSQNNLISYANKKAKRILNLVSNV